MTTFAECVLPGHPDKLSDRIADGLVDEAIARDADALVGVEVALHRNHVFVDGRIATRAAETIDVEAIVHAVFRESGYGPVFPPDPLSLTILTNLCVGELPPDERLIRTISDDQNIVTGYAVFNPATNHLPVAHYAAHTVARALDEMQRKQSLIGSDGKVLIVFNGKEHRTEAISVSLHHTTEVGTIEILTLAKKTIKEVGLKHPAFGFRDTTTILVNGAGDFAVGGPEGDNGLSGKKLVVDAYGPHVPIGGGALSGKDPHKIDRAMALRARQIAKHLVMAGVTKKALVTLAFAPGDAAPRWQVVQLGDRKRGWRNASTAFTRRWLSGYDLTLEGTFNDLTLHKVSWQPLAAWGHFTDPLLPWERWNIGQCSLK